MKLNVTVEEFIYAKKIENQTQRTLRGYIEYESNSVKSEERLKK